jgi:hypothetical protein
MLVFLSWEKTPFRQTTILSARADFERIRVPAMALFRRNTLCIARKRDEAGARIVRKMPKAMGSAFASYFAIP